MYRLSQLRTTQLHNYRRKNSHTCVLFTPPGADSTTITTAPYDSRDASPTSPRTRATLSNSSVSSQATLHPPASGGTRTRPPSLRRRAESTIRSKSRPSIECKSSSSFYVFRSDTLHTRTETFLKLWLKSFVPQITLRLFTSWTLLEYETLNHFPI